MGFFLGDTDPEFQAVIDEVRRALPDEYGELKKQAQAAIPSGNKVLRVFLDGSYARGDARRTSDIDVRVVYLGPASPGEVAEALHGQLIGHYGVYDIHPQHQIAEAEQKRYAKKLEQLAEATRPRGIPPTPTTLLYFIGRLGIGAVVTALAYMAGRRLGYADAVASGGLGPGSGQQLPPIGGSGPVVEAGFSRESRAAPGTTEAEAEIMPTQPKPKGDPS